MAKKITHNSVKTIKLARISNTPKTKMQQTSSPQSIKDCLSVSINKIYIPV